MFLKLYKHNKRINSTLLPSEEDVLISGEVSLKSATSVDEPVFVMACGEEHMSYARICNYAECQGNYYWVVDTVQMNKNHIQITCKLDPLTTYKNQILATKAYVIYSDSAGRVDLLDNRNVRTINWVYAGDVSEEVNMFKMNGGSFILEVINGSPSLSISSSTFYLMSTPQMAALMQGLYDTGDFFDSIVKSIQNPSNLMIKAIWYPFAINAFQGAFTGAEETVKIGNYECSASGYRITKVDYSSTSELIHIDLNDILQSNYNFDESNCSIKCNLPFYGLVELPVATVLKSGARDFFIRISLDIFTGTIMYEILASAGEISYRSQIYKTPFGVTVPLGMQSYNPLQFIGTVAGAVGGVMAAANLPASMAAGTAVSSGVIGAGNIIGSTASLQKSGGVVGVLGSRVDYGWNTRIVVTVLKAVLAEGVTAKKEVLGLPYCSTVELSTLTGYCQTQNVSVSAIAREPILNEINAFLNGGIYIE